MTKRFCEGFKTLSIYNILKENKGNDNIMSYEIQNDNGGYVYGTAIRIYYEKSY